MAILAIPISQNGQNIYFVKHPFSFQHIQNVNSVIVKSYFKFLLFHKIYFNFKSKHFKCLYPNTHSHSNTFKIINSFYTFHLEWSK